MAIDREGNTEQLIGERDRYYMPRASPDGRRLAVGVLRDGDYDIWIVDLGRRTRTRFPVEGNTPAFVWSPDSSRIAYGATRDGTSGLFVRSLEGDSTDEVLTTFDNASAYPISWPRGGPLLFSLDAPGLSEDIYAIALEGGEDPYPFLASDMVADQGAVVSPNGRWVTYSDSDNGVSVKALSDPGPVVVVAPQPSGMPRWSLDGDELYFLAGDGYRRVMVVSVGTEDPPSGGGAGVPMLSEPRLLLEYTFGGSIGFGLHRYDVMQDGRFVFASPDQETSSTHVNVLINWVAELDRLVPAGR